MKRIITAAVAVLISMSVMGQTSLYSRIQAKNDSIEYIKLVNMDGKRYFEEVFDSVYAAFFDDAMAYENVLGKYVNVSEQEALDSIVRLAIKHFYPLYTCVSGGSSQEYVIINSFGIAEKFFYRECDTRKEIYCNADRYTSYLEKNESSFKTRTFNYKLIDKNIHQLKLAMLSGDVEIYNRSGKRKMSLKEIKAFFRDNYDDAFIIKTGGITKEVHAKNFDKFAESVCRIVKVHKKSHNDPMFF